MIVLFHIWAKEFHRAQLRTKNEGTEGDPLIENIEDANEDSNPGIDIDPRWNPGMLLTAWSK